MGWTREVDRRGGTAARPWHAYGLPISWTLVGVALLVTLAALVMRDLPGQRRHWQWLQGTRLIQVQLVALEGSLPASRPGMVMLGSAAAPAVATGYRRYRLDDWDGEQSRAVDLFFSAADDALTRTLIRWGALPPPAVGDIAWLRYQPGHPEDGHLVTWPQWEWLSPAVPLALAALWAAGALSMTYTGLRAWPRRA